MKRISSSEQRKIGIVLSYTHIILQILVGIIYTPYVLRTIGQNEYGLFNTVKSAAEMLTVLNLGFSASYIRFYSKFKNNNEPERINSFNALFFLSFAVLSAIALIAGVFLSFNLRLVFDKGLTPQELADAKIMMILLTFSVAMGFMMTLFNCFVTAKQQFIFSKGSHIAQVVVMLLFNLAALFMGGKALELTISRVAAYLLINAVTVVFCFKRLHLKFDFKHIEKSLFKEVFLFSALIAINIIVDKINTGIDSVLIGRFCGTAAVAIYAIGATINGYFTTFSISISGVYTPMVHDIVNTHPMDSTEQRYALTDLFTKVARFQYLLLALILSGFVFFGKPFILLWAGEGYEMSYWICLVMMAPSIVPLTQNVGIEIQRAENRHHYRSYIYGAMAIVNLIVSIILVQKYEGLGAAIGTGMACIIANIIIMDIVYHKKININIHAYWKNIGRQTLGMLVPFAIGAVIMHFVTITGWLTLVIWIAVYSAIYLICVWLFSMNRYEKHTVTAAADKILKTHFSDKYKIN